MAGGATTEVEAEYFAEGADGVAIGAGLGVRLAEIGCQVNLYCMINCTVGFSMIMAVEISSVTGDAFTTASNGRRDQGSIGRRVMTSGAALCCVSLANTNKGRSSGRMAPCAICSGRCNCQVLCDLSAMVVGVAIEIGRVTLDAGAPGAAVD